MPEFTENGEIISTLKGEIRALENQNQELQWKADKAAENGIKKDEYFREAQALRNKLRHLAKIVIRLFVSIKYLFRLGAIIGTYFWLGRDQAAALAGFICLIALIQAGIDGVQKTLHEGRSMSEWNPCE
jgi:hypothetical protein